MVISVQENLLLQVVMFSLSLVSLNTTMRLELRQILARVMVHDIHLFFLVFKVIVLFSLMVILVLEFVEDVFQLGNAILKKFFLGLGIFGILLLLVQQFCDLDLESILDFLESSLILDFTFEEKLLIHGDLSI